MSTLCCSCDPPIAVIIIIGIISTVATPQGLVQHPDAMTLGIMDSDEEM